MRLINACHNDITSGNIYMHININDTETQSSKRPKIVHLLFKFDNNEFL